MPRNIQLAGAGPLAETTAGALRRVYMSRLAQQKAQETAVSNARKDQLAEKSALEREKLQTQREESAAQRLADSQRLQGEREDAADQRRIARETQLLDASNAAKKAEGEANRENKLAIRRALDKVAENREKGLDARQQKGFADKMDFDLWNYANTQAIEDAKIRQAQAHDAGDRAQAIEIQGFIGRRQDKAIEARRDFESGVARPAVAPDAETGLPGTPAVPTLAAGKPARDEAAAMSSARKSVFARWYDKDRMQIANPDALSRYFLSGNPQDWADAGIGQWDANSKTYKPILVPPAK